MPHPSHPSETTSEQAPKGLLVLLIAWLVGGAILVADTVQTAGERWWIQPSCEASCEQSGTTYSRLWVGGRGRGESACVCADNSKVTTSLVDVVGGGSVLVGLVAGIFPMYLFSRSRVKERRLAR